MYIPDTLFATWIDVVADYVFFYLYRHSSVKPRVTE